MRPVLVITCAANRSERRAAMSRLLDQLKGQDIEAHIHHDSEGKGSLGPWLSVLEWGAKSGATHITYLPDDAILVPHFVEVLHRCIEAHPEQILCFQSNHGGAPAAAAKGARWYTTPEGFTAFGGTMPVEFVREHLAWRRESIRPDVRVEGDQGVNIHAMATGRLIYKSLPSLVDHDTSIPSADGNDFHASFTPRRPLVWEPEADLRAVDWSGPVVHLGRTYKATYSWLVTRLKRPMPRRAYELARDETRAG